MVVVDGFILFGSYLAITVSRGLVVPIYKSRALWMALVGMPLALAISYNIITVVLVPNSALSTPLIPQILFTFPLISLLVWMDRTVLAVIRSDYLRRDVLHWTRLRVAYWALVIAGNVAFFASYVYGPVLVVLANVFLAVALGYGTLSLAKGAATTSDATFRSHVKWFGYLVVFFIPAVLVYSLYGGPTILNLLFLTVASYCFYRMARLLVPAGKLTTDSGFSADTPTQQPL